jgi:hypothetical protein
MTHPNAGAGNPRWKGGASSGHVQRKFDTKGKRCARCNTDKDIVRHHKDEDRKNNDKSNIEFLCRGCHSSHHHKGAKHNVSVGGRARLSEALSNRNKTVWSGRKHSEESRAKMSESQSVAAGSRKRGPDGRWS